MSSNTDVQDSVSLVIQMHSVCPVIQMYSARPEYIQYKLTLSTVLTIELFH